MKRIAVSIILVLLVIVLFSCGKKPVSETPGNLDEIISNQKKMQIQLDSLKKGLNLSGALNSVYEQLRLASNKYRIFYLREFVSSSEQTKIEGYVCLIYTMDEYKATPETELAELVNKQWGIFESAISQLKNLYPQAGVTLHVLITPEFEKSKLLDRTFLTSTGMPTGARYGTFVDGKFSK